MTNAFRTFKYQELAVKYVYSCTRWTFLKILVVERHSYTRNRLERYHSILYVEHEGQIYFKRIYPFDRYFEHFELLQRKWLYRQMAKLGTVKLIRPTDLLKH